MVTLYVADISKLPDPKDEPQLMAGLNQDRIRKIQKIQKEQTRRQSMGAGLLVNKVLEHHGVKADAMYLSKHGKPEIDNFYFNLSHSGDLVVCAVADSPVGCDVEQIRKAPERVGEYFFSENEKKYLKQFEDKAYDEAFFHIWTLKESYTKMTGEGMALSRGNYELMLNEQVRVLREGKMQNCNFAEYEVKGYWIAVCSEDAEVSEIIWETI